MSTPDNLSFMWRMLEYCSMYTRFFEGNRVILTKCLNENGTPNGQWTLESEKETVQKAAELINLFAQVPLENIKTCLLTNEGNLAIEVLTHLIADNQMKELTPLRMLVDELNEKLAAVAYNKDYVSRGALLKELEDVLKAKSITPYRRQRINRALKRECLHCLGTGKAGKIIKTEERKLWKPAVIKVGVSTTDPECPTCKGTGIKPIVRDRVKEKEAEIASNNRINGETSLDSHNDYESEDDPDNSGEDVR